MIRSLVAVTYFLQFCLLPIEALCESEDEYVTDGRYAMGTILEVTVQKGAASALDAVFEEVDRIESELSSYKENSQLSILNRLAGNPTVMVSDTLLEVLELAKYYSDSTDGAFDVSIGPLTRLWKESFQSDSVPSNIAMNNALSMVGMSKVKIVGNSVLLPTGMALDLGGIGKGYALDKVERLLARESIEHALISFGESSTLALGSPRDSEAWSLLVRGLGQEFIGRISLSDQALSVSRSLGKVTEIQGRRFGHIFDPATGTPVNREALAIVVSKTSTEAEVWSTALLVLGVDKGLGLVEKVKGTEAFIASRTGSDGALVVRMSTGFSKTVDLIYSSN